MNMEQIERICISVNTVCNLGCTYCYFYHPENRVSKELPLGEAEIIKILDQAYIYHQKYQFKKKIKVNFVGSGEPLINWKIIRNAIRHFWDKYPDQEVIKFYTVTNATLVTHKIAQEMKDLKVIPSVSIDGPKEIHDKYRLTHKQQGTFDRVIKGVEVLREVGFDVAINTTLSRDLLFGLDRFVEFVKEYGFKKVIFDRLVDTPDFIVPISYAEYYQFLENIHGKFQAAKMTDVEVGNLEAYKRNFQGTPDKVCTMFGGSCGAGSNFVIYMGKDVYPCGRMFGKEEWLLGSIDDPIEVFTQRMKKHWPERSDCKSCAVAKACVRDCLLEYHTENYSCDSRKHFLTTMKGVLI
ncbi:radical SAM protein [Orbus wheelerorum]|uniref:radical SAM protein n=1 Tax=Orbus wheelerorum TaxID=3074111 RepID=UPI00370DD1D9